MDRQEIEEDLNKIIARVNLIVEDKMQECQGNPKQGWYGNLLEAKGMLEDTRRKLKKT